MIAAVSKRLDHHATPETLMEIVRYANATTTPKQQRYIQQSSRPAAELAEALRTGHSHRQTRRTVWNPY